jgi:hypothetical protein
MAGSNPIVVRGILYISQVAAAKALGVHPRTVTKALNLGRVDELGQPVWRGGRPGKSCWYRGKWYPSRTAAALACGVSVAAVSKAAAKNAMMADAA